VKIRSARTNNRRKVLEVATSKARFLFPFVKLDPRPSAGDPIVKIWVDKELASEAVTYELASGREGSVHIEQVLEYNKDPDYLRDRLLYRLTLEAQKRIAASSLSRREIIRRLGTSASQLYRLLDQTNYSKSVDQLVSLLQILDCEVNLVVRAKSA
jgi:predicted XRE-type DNA-binding protein